MEGLRSGTSRAKVRTPLLLAALLAAFLLGALTGVSLDRAGLFGPRYVLMNAGQGQVYRLDKGTGDVWLITRVRATKVEFPGQHDGPAQQSLGSGDLQPATAPQPKAKPARVESRALGIALVGYERNGFELLSAEGEELELLRPAEGDQAEAKLTYHASPPQIAGVNLVAAVNEQAAEIDARPSGRFFGQVELMSHLGSAYSTRGRYTGADGAVIEEIRIFAVHPSGDRLLSLTYRYRPTAGDAKGRVEQAMAGLGLVEPLPPV